MFARTVSIHLKPNSVAGFAQIIEKEVIPLLRKAERLPGRNYVRRSKRNGSGGNQFVG